MSDDKGPGVINIAAQEPGSVTLEPTWLGPSVPGKLFFSNSCDDGPVETVELNFERSGGLNVWAALATFSTPPAPSVCTGFLHKSNGVPLQTLVYDAL
jgi:hypothetical protein